jgi:hypothetical protein
MWWWLGRAVGASRARQRRRASPRGVWTRDTPHPRVAALAAASARPIPTFHEYASYLRARTDGVLGDSRSRRTPDGTTSGACAGSTAVLRARPARGDRPGARCALQRRVRDARVQLHGAQMRPVKATKRRRGAERPGSPLATSSPGAATPAVCRASRDGETRTRTGDTTIFRKSS